MDIFRYEAKSTFSGGNVLNYLYGGQPSKCMVYRACTSHLGHIDSTTRLYQQEVHNINIEQIELTA